MIHFFLSIYPFNFKSDLTRFFQFISWSFIKSSIIVRHEHVRCPFCESLVCEGYGEMKTTEWMSKARVWKRNSVNDEKHWAKVRIDLIRHETMYRFPQKFLHRFVLCLPISPSFTLTLQLRLLIHQLNSCFVNFLAISRFPFYIVLITNNQSRIHIIYLQYWRRKLWTICGGCLWWVVKTLRKIIHETILYWVASLIMVIEHW